MVLDYIAPLLPSPFLVYCPSGGQVGPPPEITLPACPAAVAASRDLFLSASEGICQWEQGTGTHSMHTGFFLPLDILGQSLRSQRVPGSKKGWTGSDRDPGIDTDRDFVVAVQHALSRIFLAPVCTTRADF